MIRPSVPALPLVAVVIVLKEAEMPRVDALDFGLQLIFAHHEINCRLASFLVAPWLLLWQEDAPLAMLFVPQHRYGLVNAPDVNWQAANIDVDYDRAMIMVVHVPIFCDQLVLDAVDLFLA